MSIFTRPIVLVEDNPMDLDLTQRAFMKRNILNPVIVARDGEEALLKIQGLCSSTEKPLMVLLDLKLPKKDGFDVLTLIKKDPQLKSTPVIVLTSSSDSGDIKKAYDLGANSYIIKPVDYSIFVTVASQIYEYWSMINILPG
jgi:CheY-like chemotaxis protein